MQDFIDAYEAFHDGRQPTNQATLERAVRLASESMRAVDLQVRRIRGSEPEDDEWLFRAWMDLQFLIVALWRLRLVGHLAARINDGVQKALKVFNREIPDLKLMRDVAQHLDEYAIDAGHQRCVGHRSLEVGDLNTDEFQWLGGTLNLPQARQAAVVLYLSIKQARDASISLDATHSGGESD